MEIFKKLVALVLVTVFLAVPVFADYSDYGSGSIGASPYGTGSIGGSPYSFGSIGGSVYGWGSIGANPYGSGSIGASPYGTTTSGTGGTTTGNNPVPNPTPNPNPNPSPGPSGTTWASLSNQIIPEDAPVGTIVYSGLKSLCFDPNGVNMQVTTTSPNFDLIFRNNDLVLNRLTANFNGQELVGLDCNGRANSFVLTVSAINDAPTFTSTPVTTATRNILYSYDANAVDVEGNTITFALITSPSGMTIDSNSGLVRWTPSSTQTGSFTVQVRATDSQGANANQAYVITVSRGGSGGGSSGSSGSSDRHSLEISNVDLDKSNFVCGENFNAVVSLVNNGKFSEAASVRIENEGLEISQSKSTSVTKGSSKDVEFTFTIPADAAGSYTLVTKLTYPSGNDFDYKTVSVTCQEKKEIEKVITTTENKGKERNLGMIITLILAIIAAGGLIVWFVLLLKDEYLTTERFI